MADECVVIRYQQLVQTLASPPAQGKRSLEPLRAFAITHSVPMHIVEDHQVTNNRAEVHTHEGDFWICLQGPVMFVVGGELDNPQPYRPTGEGVEYREWSAERIIDGKVVVLEPGDMLWIPAGQPHQHNCSKTARLLLVKVPR